MPSYGSASSISSNLVLSHDRPGSRGSQDMRLTSCSRLISANTSTSIGRRGCRMHSIYPRVVHICHTSDTKVQFSFLYPLLMIASAACYILLREAVAKKVSDPHYLARKETMNSETTFFSFASTSSVIFPSFAIDDRMSWCDVLMCCRNSFSNFSILAGSILSK